MNKNIHREITPLAPEDSFLVFERTKSYFGLSITLSPRV